MLKTILLATAMTISVPAFAQITTADPQAAPMSPSAPAQSAAPSAAAPMAQAPASPESGQPAIETAQQPAQQPASGPAQVAQVVDSEFATYDKNKDGVLSKTEFGNWMIALKTASDPSTKAETAATKTWVGQAFASADKDRSKTVSKTELTGFLSQGQS